MPKSCKRCGGSGTELPKIIRIVGNRVKVEDDPDLRAQLIIDLDDPRVPSKVSIALYGDLGILTSMESSIGEIKNLRDHLKSQLERLDA